MKLDASAHTIPITYLGQDGKQYVVIMSAGGGIIGDKAHASSLTAFTLP